MLKNLIKTITLFVLANTLVSANFTVDEKLISFKMGNGKKQLYIAANPECKYTRIFFDEAKEKLKEYTVNVFLLEREHLKKSYGMIDYILMGKTNEDRVKRFKDIIFNDSKEYEKLPSYATFKEKVKVEKKLRKALYEQECVKKGWESFEIKKKLYYLDAHYKFAKENEEYLKEEEKLLELVDATNSPTIFDGDWKLLNWMNLVESKEHFRERCYTKR